MASQSLISTVNGYENYIKDKGKDEQVINAYVDACSVAINGEKDIEYGLQLTKRAKELIEAFYSLPDEEKKMVGGEFMKTIEADLLYSNFFQDSMDSGQEIKDQVLRSKFAVFLMTRGV